MLQELIGNFESLINWLNEKKSKKNPFGILFQLFRNIWMETPPDEIHIRLILQELAEESKLTEKEIPLLMNILMPLYNTIASLNDKIIPIMNTDDYDGVFVEELRLGFEPYLSNRKFPFEEMKKLLVKEAECILKEASQFLELPFDWKTFLLEEQEEVDEDFDPFDLGYEEGHLLFLASVRNEFIDEDCFYEEDELWVFFIPIFVCSQVMDKLRRERLMEKNGF
ncbi:MAG: hypothetical protein JJT78_15485 [Leptospira sp.]|nr:hypothetical protein [Leptospira sp.]